MAMKMTQNQRRFELIRREDETGVSGTGRVAEGCSFSDGKCAVRWLSECASWVLYDNVQSVMQVHGHGGKTMIRWLDSDAFEPSEIEQFAAWIKDECRDGESAEEALTMFRASRARAKA